MIKLNLGSGSIPIEGYVNVDIHKDHPNFAVDVVYDIKKIKELYKDLSVDEIFAKDVIEHIVWRDVPKLLQDWIDILRPGGVLKLRTPDLEMLIKEYQSGKSNFNRFVQLVFGDQDFEANTHKVGFKTSLLVKTLEEMGMSVLPPWYDGGRDLRITAVKKGAEALVDLDHPDYQYKELSYKQMKEKFKK